jgi:lipid-binding SYLF domain-containing protein
MKTKLYNRIMIALLSAVVTGFVAHASAAESLQQQAQETISTFKQKDPSLEAFFRNSAGYAVFPSIGQGGFIVGGAHGKGVVYENGKAVGQATISKGSVGAQAGGGTFSEIIFFQTPQALQEFKGGNFEMSGQLSAVVAAEGAARTANYSQGVAVFTLPQKGAMVQAAVGGQKFSYEPLAK